MDVWYPGIETDQRATDLAFAEADAALEAAQAGEHEARELAAAYRAAIHAGADGTLLLRRHQRVREKCRDRRREYDRRFRRGWNAVCNERSLAAIIERYFGSE